MCAHDVVPPAPSFTQFPATPSSFQGCCDAINACRRSAQWQGAVASLTWLQQQRLRPNVIVHGAATSACEKSSQWRQAVQQLGFASIGLQIDVVLYNNMMNACQKGGGSLGLAIVLVCGLCCWDFPGQNLRNCKEGRYIYYVFELPVAGPHCVLIAILIHPPVMLKALPGTMRF